MLSCSNAKLTKVATSSKTGTLTFTDLRVSEQYQLQVAACPYQPITITCGASDFEKSEPTPLLLTRTDSFSCKCPPLTEGQMGSVCGWVMDSHCLPIAALEVRLFSPNNMLVAVTHTDQQGVYSFCDVPYGRNYKIIMEPRGYAKVVAHKDILNGKRMIFVQHLLEEPGA